MKRTLTVTLAGVAVMLATAASAQPYNLTIAGYSPGGLVSTAAQQSCASGPASSASLIVGISTSNLETMQASTNYTGVLTLLVAPQ